VKLVPTYEAGIPDRLVLYKSCAVFVELKKPGEKPRKLQLAYMQQLERLGFECCVVDSYDGVDGLIHKLLEC